MIDKKCTEEHVGRQVIQNQILASLEDKSKVALLITEEDLKMLISALNNGPDTGSFYKRRQFAADLEQLRNAAFK